MVPVNGYLLVKDPSLAERISSYHNFMGTINYRTDLLPLLPISQNQDLLMYAEMFDNYRYI